MRGDLELAEMAYHGQVHWSIVRIRLLPIRCACIDAMLEPLINCGGGESNGFSSLGGRKRP